MKQSHYSYSPDLNDHSSITSSSYETQSSDLDTATENDTDDSLYVDSSSPSPVLRPSYEYNKQSYYQANDLRIPLNCETHLYSDFSPNNLSRETLLNHNNVRGTPRMSTPLLLGRSTSNQSNSSYQLVSETLHEQEPSELVRFMVTVDTDLQTFVARVLSVLIASLVVFSLSGDLSAWHGAVTAPVLVFGLVVFFHASSDHAILRNLFIACCILTLVLLLNCLISILIFDSSLSDHLWDIALLGVIFVMACSLFDLYRTKQRLTKRYRQQYYDDVKRTSSGSSRKLSVPHASSSDDETGTVGRARSLSQERVESQDHFGVIDTQLNPLSILHSMSLSSHDGSVRHTADKVEDS